MTRRIPAPRRAAFTLIELLVVIAIIAILVALTSAAVMQVRSSAKRTAASAEIAQIGSAVGAFKAKFGVYPVAFQPGSTGAGFRLCTSYQDPTNPGQWLKWPEVTYLKQLFPQMGMTDNGLRFNGNPIPPTAPHVLDPNQLLLLFLTGSVYSTNPQSGSGAFQGFSINKVSPFAPIQTAGEQRVGPFLDVNVSKIGAPNNSGTAGVPWYLDPWGSPYAFFAFDTSLNSYPQGATWPTNTVVGPSGHALAPAGVVAYVDGTGKPFQAKSFQIISAGANQAFGPGGNWSPGSGAWSLGNYNPQAPYPLNVPGSGGDDMSNFNNGQLTQVSAN